MMLLFWEFFKIGLFSVGGGLATLPFLYKLADKYNWFTIEMIGDMIAISESTPGPIGINMATYTGYQHSGVIGALISTIGLVVPSIIIIIIIAKFLKKFRKNKYVDNAFATLRPTVVGLIGAAGFNVIIDSLKNSNVLSENSFDFINIKALIFFIIIFVMSNVFKKHPLFYIAIGAAVGIIFKF